jgi:two-component system phosphate regulon sensor histidine kinase PhoR
MIPPGSAVWFLLGAAAGLVLAVVLQRLRARGAAQEAALRDARDRQQRADAEARADALRAETATLNALIEGVADGVWLADADGVVLRHNQALRALLQPGQELLGKRPLALLRNERLHAAVERACRSGESSEVELTLDQRVLAVHVAPLRREVPGPSLAVFRDITELRRLERVRQEFVANVSHELRTPITAIMGYSETLLAGALGDPAHAPGMVEIIHRQSQRLSRLVGDLLELSLLDAQKVAVETATVRLEPVAQRAAEALAPRLDQKRITFVADVPTDLLAAAEERALEQVLVNLLDNAVKYTPEGGRISLRGRLDGERVRLSVRDSGVGIPPQHLPRLFERFYRVDPGRSRALGGTGLGLSIVKHLVSAMGGELEVDSQPGEGSEFSVLLLSASPKANPAG